MTELHHGFTWVTMTGECDQTHRAGLITGLSSVRGDECVAFLWTSCPLCPHRGCKWSPVKAGTLPSQVPCGIDVGCGGADRLKTCLQHRIDQRQKAEEKKSDWLRKEGSSVGRRRRRRPQRDHSGSCLFYFFCLPLALSLLSISSHLFHIHVLSLSKQR